MIRLQSFVAARSYLAIILGFLLAFSIVLTVEHVMPPVQEDQSVMTIDHSYPASPPRRALNMDEAVSARVAWQYYINNASASGLIRSRQDQTYTTLWDLGGYVMASIAAYRLQIIPANELHARMDTLLQTLGSLELTPEKLPYIYYDVVSLKPLQPATADTARKSSLVDMGRLIQALSVLEQLEPNYRPTVQQLETKWNIPVLFKHSDKPSDRLLQEEPLIQQERDAVRGYGFLLYVTDAFRPYLPEGALELEHELTQRRVRKINDVLIPLDQNGYKNAELTLTTYPYIYQGIENGLNDLSASVLWRVLAVALNTDRPLMLRLDVPQNNVPDLLKDTDIPLFQADDKTPYLSTKSVFGLHALYQNTQTAAYHAQISKLLQPGQGWLDGIQPGNGKMNTTLSADTNAMVLESLNYIVYGPLACVWCQMQKSDTSPLYISQKG